MNTKSFDCVAMKEAGAERVQDQLAGLTPAQILEFWRERTDALREEQRRLSESFAQRDATQLLAAIGGKEAQLHPLGMGGKDGEIHPLAVKARPHRPGPPRGNRMARQSAGQGALRVHAGSRLS